MRLLVGDIISQAIREVLRDRDDGRIAAVASVGLRLRLATEHQD